MECEKCAVEMQMRRAGADAPYRYELGGGFDLSGITVYRCPSCGGESPVLPKIRQLHALMARILASKPTQLVGGEIRFLRKHAGFSAKEFAGLLDVTPSYLSRVENEHPGHKKMGGAADRLARALANEKEPARTALRRLAAMKLAKKPLQRMPRRFRLVDGRTWKAEGPTAA